MFYAREDYGFNFVFSIFKFQEPTPARPRKESEIINFELQTVQTEAAEFEIAEEVTEVVDAVDSSHVGHLQTSCKLLDHICQYLRQRKRQSNHRKKKGRRPFLCLTLTPR